jgi:hypothetical protein
MYKIAAVVKGMDRSFCPGCRVVEAHSSSQRRYANAAHGFTGDRNAESAYSFFP